MLKKIFGFFLFLVLTSCQSLTRFPARTTANIAVGKNYIITVHGFRSKGNDFGDAEKVLLTHLKKLRPELEYQFLNFSYPTGTNQDVFYFAYQSLNHFLKEKIPNPQPNDRFIFLAHSQGGLIMTAWKAAATYDFVHPSANTASMEAIKESKKYAELTEHIITVGTPYWGSNIAQLTLDIGLLKSGFDSELKGLIFNSDLILWLRELAIQMSHPSSKISDKTMYTNIAGIVPDEKRKIFYKNEIGKLDSNILDDLQLAIFNGIVKRYSFSSEKINSKKPDRFESDLAVIAPSTRSHFYYGTKALTCEDHDLAYDSFTQPSLYPQSRYVLTESLHANLATDKLNRTQAMVKIPVSCLNAAECEHPTYRYIVKAMAHCERNECVSEAKHNILNRLDEVKKNENSYDQVLTSGFDLQGFSLDINLQVPVDYHLPDKYYSRDQTIKSKKLLNQVIRLAKESMKGDFFDTLEVKLIRKREAYSGLACWGSGGTCDPRMTDLRFHITGFMKPKSLQVLTRYQQGLSQRGDAGILLPFNIILPAYKSYRPQKVTVFAKIKPGHSTYVKLNYAQALSCTASF